MIELTMYTLQSSPEVIDKILINETTINGVLNNKVNEIQPFIALVYDNYEEFSRLNYMKTDVFGKTRYYYLESCQLAGNIAYCYFDLDELMTYKDLLKDAVADISEVSDNFEDTLKFANRPTSKGSASDIQMSMGKLEIGVEDVLITGGN